MTGKLRKVFNGLEMTKISNINLGSSVDQSGVELSSNKIGSGSRHNN